MLFIGNWTIITLIEESRRLIQLPDVSYIGSFQTENIKKYVRASAKGIKQWSLFLSLRPPFGSGYRVRVGEFLF